MSARAIMVVGTSSGVGKSWLCTGLCRLLKRRGLRVAPFKAINFSSQTAPAFGAEDGLPGEIGRAQAVQAEACGLEPHVDMNPVLVRSRGPGEDDVLLLGRPEGEWRPAWRARRDLLWTTVAAAYDRLADRNDVVVIEGAGSPAELNLRGRDIANMHTAHHAKAAVLLLGDAERGGVFASLFGTLSLLSEPDRALVRGLVINRTHADPAQLAGGVEQLAAMTGVPVRGVIPYRPDVLIEHGDSLIFEEPARPARISRVDLCAVVRPGTPEPAFLPWLGDSPGLSLRRLRDASELGNPDALLFAEPTDSPEFQEWARATGLLRGLEAAQARDLPLVQPGPRSAWQVSASLAHEMASVGVDGPLRLERGVDRRALVNALRRRRGLDPIEDAVGSMPPSLRQGQYDALADLLEGCLNLSGLVPG